MPNENETIINCPSCDAPNIVLDQTSMGKDGLWINSTQRADKTFNYLMLNKLRVRMSCSCGLILNSKEQFANPPKELKIRWNGPLKTMESINWKEVAKSLSQEQNTKE